MIKLLFFTPPQLTEVLSEILRQNDPGHTCCSVGFSEALGTDVATLKKEDVFEDVPISDLVHLLNTYFQVRILSYDVYEVGDWGEGFAFVIE